jgi:uncharacterized protein (TIGR03435 family)
MSYRPICRARTIAGSVAIFAAQLGVFPLPARQHAEQSSAPANPEFEVASIKQSQTQKRPAPGAVFFRGGRVIGEDVTLVGLLRFAYNLSPFVDPIGGPNWIRSIRFTVDAKPGRVATPQEERLMMRALLAERFKVVAHLEDRPTAVYFLEVAKGGPKLQETAGPKGAVNRYIPFYGKNATMEQLATHLSIWLLRRPVIDKTGLKGFYNFAFQADPEAGSAASAVPGGGADGRGGEPGNPYDPANLAATVTDGLPKQLGLKVTEGKAPIPVVVVESAELPSEN